MIRVVLCERGARLRVAGDAELAAVDRVTYEVFGWSELMLLIFSERRGCWCIRLLAGDPNTARVGPARAPIATLAGEFYLSSTRRGFSSMEEFHEVARSSSCRMRSR